MPTHDETEGFLRDWEALTDMQRARFLLTLPRFVEGLRTNRFPAGLRVKRYHAIAGSWEMTWAPDGRAIFRYGESSRADDKHVIWLRIGTHDIFE